MNIPLIGYQPQELLNFMRDVCKIPPGTRTKPVVCNICTMGKGKTRALMSIFEASICEAGVLCLPITMNYLWGDYMYDQWFSSSDTSIIDIPIGIQPTLSIISRLASAFYGITHKQSFEILKKYKYNFVEYDNPKLIRDF